MRYYANPGPTREDVEAMPGMVVLEFGTGWCGYCNASAPWFEDELAKHGDVRHVRIEDGSGRKLGRSFGIKLWPTFVFLRAGREVARLVRPRETEPIADAFAVMRDAAARGSAHAARP